MLPKTEEVLKIFSKNTYLKICNRPLLYQLPKKDTMNFSYTNYRKMKRYQVYFFLLLLNYVRNITRTFYFARFLIVKNLLLCNRGLEAIFKDYLRPSVVGDTIPKFCDVYAGLVSIYLAVALLWISFYGTGVVKTIKHLWLLDPVIEK